MKNLETQGEEFRIRMLALPGDHSDITDRYAAAIAHGDMTFDPNTDILSLTDGSGWETMVTDGGILREEYYRAQVKGKPEEEILKHRHNLRLRTPEKQTNNDQVN
jgi:hypothetical protein